MLTLKLKCVAFLPRPVFLFCVVITWLTASSPPLIFPASSFALLPLRFLPSSHLPVSSLSFSSPLLICLCPSLLLLPHHSSPRPPLSPPSFPQCGSKPFFLPASPVGSRFLSPLPPALKYGSWMTNSAVVLAGMPLKASARLKKDVRTLVK